MLFLPASIKNIIGAKRDQFSIFCGHMDSASLEPLQVQVPDILKSHGSETEAVFLKLADQAVPLGKFVAAVVIPLPLSAKRVCRVIPGPFSCNIVSGLNNGAGFTTTVIVFSFVAIGQGDEATVFINKKVSMKRTQRMTGG